MAEFLLDEDSERVEWIVPDERGATIRTRFKNTEAVLDRNARIRNATPANFKGRKGETFYHAASVPLEVVELMGRKLGRMPTALELLKLAQDRDYSKLKTRDVKL